MSPCCWEDEAVADALLNGDTNADERFEECIARFEESWEKHLKQGGPRPVWYEFLPVDEPLRSRLVRELACIDLERRLACGDTGCGVSDYLQQMPELAVDRAAVRELLQVEQRRRLDRPGPLSTARDEPTEAEPPRADSNATTSRPPCAENWPTLPGYEVLGELGRGGMGVVYLARQVQPSRLVALKMLLAGRHAGGERRARFLAEADAIARLQHPGIVAVYDFGEHDGLPFLVLEYVAGDSLAQRLGGVPQPPHQAAELVEALARAADHAHQHGVIHRDLKPANVLLAGERPSVSGPVAADRRADAAPLARLTPKITDFGLARHERPELTDTGAVLGTPSYMAPEQAQGKGKEVGPAADIYALGAVLYECLTGRPPFVAESAMDTLVQVISDEPVPPRQLNSKVPADLETVCLKCLHKEPAKRYASAGDLAEDLRRFLASEPIRARRISPWERAGKWAKRRPAAAALVAVSGLTTLALVSGLTALALVVQQQIRDRAQLYEKGVALAERYIATGQPDQAREALDGCPPELHHWEWRYLSGLCRPRHVELHGHEAAVRSVCWSPDWQRVLTGGQDGTARLWEAATGKQLRRFTGHRGEVVACFACNGRFVLSAGREQEVRLWNADTGQLVRRLSGAGDLAACDMRGKWLATVGRNKQLRLFELAGGREVWNVALPAEMVSLAMSPDGRYLASGCYQRAVELREVPSGKLVPLDAPPAEGVPWALAFSRDGRYLAAGLPQPVMWDVRSGRVAHTFSGTGHLLCSNLDFSPGDDRLVGTSRDGLVRVWKVSSQLMVRGPARHDGLVMAAAFGRDGKWLAVTRGTTVTIEELYGRVEPCRKLEGHRRHDLEAVAFSPDGRWLASLAGSGEVLLWDAEADFRFTRLAAPGPGARGGLAFAKEGGPTWLWTGGDRLSRWAVEDRAKGSDENGPARCLAVRAGPAPELAFTSGGKTVTRRRLDDGSEKTFTVAGGEIKALAFHPTDGSLAVGDVYGVVRLCSAATGATQRELRGHRSPVTALAFSGDGALLATAAADLDVHLWDVRTGKELGVLRGHVGALTCLAFSPDGARLVSCASDGWIKVWDSRRGVELLTLEGSKRPVTAVAFDPTGERLASCGHDGVVRIWEAGGQR
jgi:WD40 repeat protein/serine/threonine protein kinase